MLKFLLGIYVIVGSLVDAAPKIFICFPFFNELELLKCQFEELYHHVDGFVISEATHTFQGNSKPLYFAENQHLFTQYEDKIRYVLVADFPEDCNTWRRECIQRNSLVKGIPDANPEDIVVVVDADEIVRATKLDEIVSTVQALPFSTEPVSQRQLRKELSAPIVYLQMYASGQFINASCGKWTKAYAGCYGFLNPCAYDHFRINIHMHFQTCPIIEDAGWHFSSLGGLHEWATKFESFSHSEANTPYKKSLEFYLLNLKAKTIVPIDETFPKYIRDNLDHFLEIGFIYDGQLDEELKGL